MPQQTSILVYPERENFILQQLLLNLCTKCPALSQPADMQVLDLPTPGDRRLSGPRCPIDFNPWLVASVAILFCFFLLLFFFDMHDCHFFIVGSPVLDGQFAFSGVVSQNFFCKKIFCNYRYCINVLFWLCDEISVLSVCLSVGTHLCVLSVSTVTHPSSSRARCRLTTLIVANTLTTALRHHRMCLLVEENAEYTVEYTAVFSRQYKIYGGITTTNKKCNKTYDKT